MIDFRKSTSWFSLLFVFFVIGLMSFAGCRPTEKRPELMQTEESAEAEETDECHPIFIEKSEDEYYVRVEHEMTKQHYISFLAALSPDRIQMVKLYPEGNAEARFKMKGVKRIFCYCNRDGLFRIDPVKGIDDRESGYDHTQERRELEKTAKMIFG